MATAGSAAGLILGLLSGLGQAMHQRRLEERQGQAQQMALLKDSGEFLPASAQEASQAMASLPWLQRLFGSTPPGFYNVGGQMTRFEPAGPLPLELAKRLGLTSMVPREVAEPPAFSTLQQRFGTPDLTREIDPGVATLPSSQFTPESFAQGFQPTTRTVEEEQVMPGLGRFTAKQRQALALEATKQRRQDQMKEQEFIRKSKLELIKGGASPAELQAIRAAQTVDELLAAAPTQKRYTVKDPETGEDIHVDGKTLLNFRGQQAGLDIREQGLKLREEMQGIRGDLAALARQRETRLQQGFERGAVSPEEAAARRRLGKSLTGVLSPEEHAEVGEEMLTFRGRAAGVTTAAREEATAPRRAEDRELRREAQRLRQRVFARGPMTAAERLAREQERIPITQPLDDEQAERVNARVNQNAGQRAKAGMEATFDMRERLAQAQREETPIGKEATDKLDGLLAMREAKTTIMEILARRATDPKFLAKAKQFTGPWKGFVTQYLSQPFVGGDEDENRFITALRTLQSDDIRVKAGLAQTGTEVQRAIGFFQGRLPTVFNPPDVFESRLNVVDAAVERQLRLQVANLKGRNVGRYLEDYLTTTGGGRGSTTVIPRQQNRSILRKALDEEP